MKTLRIATRGSRLALYQAKLVGRLLSGLDVDSELVILKTQGDKQQHLSFDKIEGKGFFTKEIEDALLDNRADIAVHSLKDLPTTSPDGLILAAIPDRSDHRDWLIIHPDAVDKAQAFHIKQNAIIGTSSARRSAIMTDLRPDISIKHLRGNVPTRVQKLKDGDYDGIIMAGAGISRLDLVLDDVHIWKFHEQEFPPAPAQGCIVIQCRTEDIDTRSILKKLHQDHVSECSNVDRSVIQALDGGCHIALGVFTQRDNNGFFHTHMAYGQNGTLLRKKYSRSSTHGLRDTILQDIRSL